MILKHNISPIIKYKVLPAEQVSYTRQLWEELNKYHTKRSVHFSKFFKTFTFEKRLKKYSNKAIKVRVDIAYIPKKGTQGPVPGRPVGFCLASVKGTEGRLDSIFVVPTIREQGIGGRLMKRAMRWMSSLKAKDRSISVLFGNEEVFPFYARFGFRPMRYTLLTKKGK